MPDAATTPPTSEPTGSPSELELLQDATQRLVRCVDGMPGEAWAGPSLLPGWTRAHVVAHLALNGEALAGVLAGIVQGEPVPMYESQARRDADIEELATGATPGELRDRLLAATTDFADAVASVPEDAWDAVVERVPGGSRTFPASTAIGMRLREVEIHLVDLAAGPTRADWSPAFAALVLDAAGARGSAREPFRAHATDLDRTWEYGEGGPTVSGTAADLAWWVTGRGEGEGLTTDNGELPGIEAW